ncbi:DUF1992 domain-containing protein [Streptomyces sp. ISL-36]|uniref:DnaJ family domain-containing protein n=1 Tax=Streptomyces sp. ISL-36 TaxID=2819182 RepID=UPI001BEB161C|nr:DUF1992 domain-containing protein [Streptomyces sp. ISL-36]MBT2440823.1 DUF1992 domain-containing protein [Streptomyces sp. ISL-36]
MTERKPPGVSFESFVDKQIREAAERGEFRKLPGFGKPLDDDRAPYDELWWIKGKLHREGASVLPPALALRKEAEDAREAIGRAVSEAQVRRILGEINTKIAAALARPPAGPPLNLRPFDVEATLRQWRAGRSRQDRRDTP